MAEKQKIYYARTYRHLRRHSVKSILYMLLLVLPCLFLTVMNLQNITQFIAELGVYILGKVFPGIPMTIAQSEFSILGYMKYIDMPTVYPTIPVALVNLVVIVGLVILLSTGKRTGKPAAIFMLLCALIHTINCVYFIFAANHFPYRVFQFSDLYMKQQIGIWLVFIVLSGLVTGMIGNKGFGYKILTFVAIIAYSFIFGTVRYILFLYLLQQFSILYMAIMYFVFGPLFDFLYLVAIYSIFVNKMTSLYDQGKGAEEWEWL